MGARIVFFTAKNDKSLKENFLADYSNFRNWVLSDWNTSELKEVGLLSMGQEINTEAIKHLSKNQNFNKNINQALFDELLAIYLGSYCDHGDGKKLYELRGPMMNKWKYENSTKLVNQKCNQETASLWNRLHVESAVNNETLPSQSLSNDLVVGWWSVEELKKLDYGLINIFKSPSFFNDWKDSRKNGNFTHKEELKGIEYVYDILDIGISENKAIFFYNETES
ncbi:hypothetical protein [Tenacibaculum sp. M341]|uniref:hypothetical protein n=1 Tax=Tenacibaculum sp. M341 TaxID=2530339 RepID=UPI001053E55E|nr:hypothetical protein [Tenacibaculum sp. M341]TCI84714.1 hypothetical protein EYW44_19945 [Tenacibaculum sp. M341]